MLIYFIFIHLFSVHTAEVTFGKTLRHKCALIGGIISGKDVYIQTASTNEQFK
jgi:hypothetical protein